MFLVHLYGKKKFDGRQYQLTLGKVGNSDNISRSAVITRTDSICFVVTNQTYQAYFKKYTSQTGRHEGWY